MACVKGCNTMSKHRRDIALLCGHSTEARKGGKKHLLCVKCLALYPLFVERCDICGGLFALSPAQQFIYARRGHRLPARCPECRRDIRLFMTTMRIVEERCRCAVGITFKQDPRPGLPAGRLVAVMRTRRDNALKAMVTIEVQPNGERIPKIEYASSL